MLALDTHAHIKPDIAGRELEALDACVFAATRSLDEYDEVADRTDANVAWGVGCHPGLVGSIRAFDQTRFHDCLATAAVVAEVGLDGSSRVQMSDQAAVFDAALEVLTETPRLVSVHSYKATGAVVEALERHRPPGVILHWWLGTEDETCRAVEAGASFSLNGAQARRWPLVHQLPTDRILLETDHPFGDRRSSPRRPGNMADVERLLAAALNISPADLRRLGWQNLRSLVAETPAVGSLLPREFQVQLLTV